MEEQAKEKTAFAALLYSQPGVNPFQAALSLFPHDTGIALRISQTWPSDPFVLDEIGRFAGETSAQENAIPTKEDLMKTVWGWINNTGGLMTFDEKIKAAKLYAELGTMIQKPEAAKPEDHTVTHKVFLARDFGEPETWEDKMLRNQQKLHADGLKEIQGDVIASD